MRRRDARQGAENFNTNLESSLFIIVAKYPFHYPCWSKWKSDMSGREKNSQFIPGGKERSVSCHPPPCSSKTGEFFHFPLPFIAISIKILARGNRRFSSGGLRWTVNNANVKSLFNLRSRIIHLKRGETDRFPSAGFARRMRVSGSCDGDPRLHGAGPDKKFISFAYYDRRGISICSKSATIIRGIRFSGRA